MEKNVAEVKKNQSMKTGCIGLIVIVLIPIVWFALNSFYDKEVTKSSSTKSARQERIEAQFSHWDGSHRKLTKRIKASMHNPKSYKHVKTAWVDHGDYLNVVTQYRGENLFGTTVTNFVTARVSLDGEILEIVDGSGL